MKFKKIYIENYRSLKNFSIIFEENNNFYKTIYKNMNLNIIAGENGSGKSSVLSFIALVFHNIHRFPKRINSNFNFIYTLKNYEGDISLKLVDSFIEIKTQSEHYKFNIIKSKNNNLPLYLIPSEITVSYFSIDSFYPNQRPYNYIGKKININKIDDYNILKAQHLNLTRGILLFFKKYNDVNFKNKLKKTFNIIFYEKVPFYINITSEEIINDIYYKYSKELKKLKFNEKSFFYSLIDNSFFKNFIKSNDKFFNKIVFDINKIVKNTDTIYLNILIELIENNILYFNDIGISKHNDTTSFLDMSSGEKSFIYRILGSLSNAYDNSIILFDELEAHLNILWTRDIIWFIKELFSEFHLQLIITTHSYLFINSVFNENLIFLENFKVKKIKKPIFLANEIDIFKLFYPKQNILSSIEEDIITLFFQKKISYKNIDKIANAYIQFLLMSQQEKLND